jgi:hypothetical protein
MSDEYEDENSSSDSSDEENRGTPKGLLEDFSGSGQPEVTTSWY